MPHSVLLKPSRIGVAFDLTALRLLAPGWYDGAGEVPSAAGLDWLQAQWGDHWPAELAQPYVYPTIDGLVLLEWTHRDISTSLEVDVGKHTAELHAVDTCAVPKLAVLVDQLFDVTTPSDWRALMAVLAPLVG